MMQAGTKDVSKVLVLAVVLIGLLIALFIWNQQTGVLDPLASRVYSFFVSR